MSETVRPCWYQVILSGDHGSVGEIRVFPADEAEPLLDQGKIRPLQRKPKLPNGPEEIKE